MSRSSQAIASTIDHSLLNPFITHAEVLEGCRIALQYQVASVCVRPCDIGVAVQELGGSSVRVGTVIAFPHGGQLTATKVAEARQAIEAGAVELDVVNNTGWVKSQNWDAIQKELEALVAVSRSAQATSKLIFETCYLNPDEITRLSQVATEAGFDFLKTSTGFGSAGATEAAIIAMRAAVSGPVQFKASGGIRDRATAERFLDLGCTRLGTSRTVEILADAHADPRPPSTGVTSTNSDAGSAQLGGADY